MIEVLQFLRRKDVATPKSRSSLLDRVIIEKENLNMIEDKKTLRKMLSSLSKDLILPENVKLKAGKFYGGHPRYEFYIRPYEKNQEIDGIKLNAQNETYAIEFQLNQTYIELNFSNLGKSLAIFRYPNPADIN